MGVIEQLETVDVEQDQSKAVAVGRALAAFAQPAQQRPAVGQPRELVVRGLVQHRRHRVALLGLVGDHGLQRRLAIPLGAPDRKAQVQQRAVLAPAWPFPACDFQLAAEHLAAQRHHGSQFVRFDAGVHPFGRYLRQAVNAIDAQKGRVAVDDLQVVRDANALVRVPRQAFILLAQSIGFFGGALQRRLKQHQRQHQPQHGVRRHLNLCRAFTAEGQ